MNSKVVIVADATTGAVIHVSANNPDYGYVRLQQVRTVVDDNGFLRRQVMSALIQAPVGILQEMGYHAGQILDGKIIIKESLTPFNKKSPERDLKVAGKTGIVCTVDGQPIYRKTVYNTSSNAADLTIQHDNVEELRTAYAMQSAAVTPAMKPNEDFTI
jgi:hypothetical protein